MYPNPFTATHQIVAPEGWPRRDIDDGMQQLLSATQEEVGTDCGAETGDGLTLGGVDNLDGETSRLPFGESILETHRLETLCP